MEHKKTALPAESGERGAWDYPHLSRARVERIVQQCREQRSDELTDMLLASMRTAVTLFKTGFKRGGQSIGSDNPARLVGER